MGAVLFNLPTNAKKTHMSNLQTIPFQFNGNNLNVIQINDEPWFIAKEISTILEYRNASDATRMLDDDEKLIRTICVSGQNRAVNLINESGLYSLVLRSKKKEAKEFKRWVTHEVLPSIRKHGAYLTPEKTEELLADPDLIIQLASQLKAERQAKDKLLGEIDQRNEIIEVQEQQLKIQTPAVKYYTEVLKSSSLISSNVIAKELGMSAVTLHKILHEDYRMIYRQGGTWMLYSKYQGMGLARTRTFTYTDSRGELHTKISLAWTETGRRWIHGMFSLRKK